MRPNVTYRVTGMEEDGQCLIVGEGLTYSQADIICHRLKERKVFSVVSMEPDPSPSSAEVCRSAQNEPPNCRRRLYRILTALGLM